MPTHHILVATDLTEESLAILRAAEDVRLTIVPPKTATVRQALHDAHVIIARDDLLIDADLIGHAPQLKIIARMSAGLTGVDIESATLRGILVMNTPGVNAIAAAELTLALMLALSRKLVVTHNSLKEGWWLLDRKRQAGTQLHSKTLGLVGYGRVGRVVANRCLAFGMTVLVYDPYISEEQVGDNRIQLVGLDELLAQSDFVSIHVPATRETTGLFNDKVIAQMKLGARLINTSHGGVIDEDALANAIKEGHLAGAAVDVYREEPPYNSPLIGLDHIIHTPHIGDNTQEAMQDLSIQIVSQVLDALRDADYRNVVNMPILPGIDYETIRPYLQLGERMGAILHALARHPVKRVAVELRGDEMTGLIKPITVALLKGLLTPISGNTVSYVNAPMLATERGWQVTQAKNLKSADYANLVLCQITLEDKEQITISGTLLDHRVPHIVQINNYKMNFVPEGYMLLMGSYDQPGVIGRVGTLLFNHHINVASWHTGRAEPGGNTLTVLTLDEPIPQTAMDDLLQQSFVRHAHQIYIPSS